MPNYPDQVRAAERAAIRKRYQRRGAQEIGLAALRVAELDREFSDRYGEEILPDDDAARDDVAIMLHHLARRSGYPLARMLGWIEWRAPWLFGDERSALIERVLANPLKFKADTLAARLGLTAERRRYLRIRSIGAIDETAAERKEARRIAKVARKHDERRAAGSVPRDEYLRSVPRSAKPWVAAGVSERTWYRHRATERVADRPAPL